MVDMRGVPAGPRIFYLISLICFIVTASSAVEVSEWTYHSNSQIDSITITEDGSRILIGGDRIHVVSRDGDLIWKAWFGDNIQVSADGGFIAFSNGRILTLMDGDSNRLWEKEISRINDLALSPDGSLIVAGDFAANVYFFDNQGNIIHETSVRLDSEQAYTEITEIVFSGEGNHVYVLTTTGIYCFNTSGSKIWSRRGEYGAGGTDIDVAYSGENFVVANDNHLQYYLKRSVPDWEFVAPRKIISVATSSNNYIIAAGSQDNTLRVFDREGNQLWDSRTELWFSSIDLSSNGSVLIAGTLDKNIYIFEGDGTLVHQLSTNDRIEDVIMSPEGSFAAAITKDTLYGFLINFAENPPSTEGDHTVTNLTSLPASTSPPSKESERSSLVNLPLSSMLILIMAFVIGIAQLLFRATKKK